MMMSHRLSRRFLLPAALLGGAGLLALLPPAGTALRTIGFDWAQRLRPVRSVTRVALVLVDEDAVRRFGTPGRETLPRRYYADLLDRLRSADSGPVVFDLAFDRPGTVPGEDEALAAAIRRHGQVVLGGFFERLRSEGGWQTTVVAPVPALRAAAVAWGLMNLTPLDDASTVRGVRLEMEGRPGLAAAAAALGGAGPLPRRTPPGVVWLNLPGPPGSGVIPTWALARILDGDVPASALAGRVIVVGAKPSVHAAGGVAGGSTERSDSDLFGTAYSGAGYVPAAGPEIHAAMIENLITGAWHRRVPAVLDLGITLAVAILAAGLIAALPAGRAASALAALALLHAALSLHLQSRLGAFTAWLVPLTVQMPIGAAFALLAPRFDPSLRRRRFDVFISYRREGGAAVARLLRAELKALGLRGFLDVDDIGAERYEDRILRDLGEADCVLVVLGPGSLDRCQAPDDWIRREVTHGLRAGVPVIPVLLPDFAFPSPEGLPPELHGLPALNGVRFSHEHYGETRRRLDEMIRQARAIRRFGNR